MEAMARGLCVIVTKTGGMKDIIEDGKNGLYVDFNDAQGIIKRILYLRGHLGAAADIAASASQTARSFSWDRVARETAEFYHRVAKDQSYV